MTRLALALSYVAAAAWAVICSVFGLLAVLLLGVGTLMQSLNEREN